MDVYCWKLFKNGALVGSTDQFVEYEMRESWIAEQRCSILSEALALDPDACVNDFRFELVYLRSCDE